MKAVLIELFKKLIVYFLFITIIFVATYSFITGEFPPKISKMKLAVTDFKTQIAQIKKLQQAASDRLLKQDFGMEDKVSDSTEAAISNNMATVEKTRSNTVSNEHYLKIYNELQSIKSQLDSIDNRLYRLEQNGQKENQKPYPVIK